MQKCIWYSPPTFLLCGLTPQFSPIILKKIMLKASENRKFHIRSAITRPCLGSAYKMSAAKSKSILFFVGFHNKPFRFGMKAHKQHRKERERVSDSEYHVQWEHLSQNAVGHR